MDVQNHSTMIDHVGTHDWKTLINGQLRDAKQGNRFVTYNPATGEAIAEVPDCGAADVDDAVAAAVEASRNLRRVPFRQRAAMVRTLAATLREHRDELAYLDAIDGGSPIAMMRADVDQACDYMEAMADLASGLTGDTVGASTDHLHYTVLEPYGAVARINAYNHPLLFSAAKSAAPIIAGNGVVVKVPEQTPLSALRMSELFVDLLPPGCLNVLTGKSTELGRLLVRHPQVRRIAFTGSEKTGRAIQQDAASVAVKHVTLELGGKNALIALEDVDPKTVGMEIVRAMNLAPSAGQSCGSTSRILVHSSIAAEVIECMQAQFEGLRVGNPVDEATDMGPVVSEEQMQKVLCHIDVAKAEGAQLVAGGGRPKGAETERGYFVAPTIFTNVKRDMRIAQEEVFGPVVAVMTFENEREAIEIANSVNFGLTASLWTNDLRAANRMSRDIEVGYVWVNDSAAHYFGLPFGGYKNSGVGREESIDELRGYCLTKSVHVAVGDS